MSATVPGRTRRSAAILVVVALTVLGACGGVPTTPAADPGASGPSEAPDAPQTFTVVVDGHTAENQGIFEAFFPNELTVHPGDAIEFVLMDSGEPHTVALGTKADEAVDLAHQFPNNDDPIAVLRVAGLPWLFPDWPSNIANQCVMEADRTSCVKGEQPPFTGSEPLYGSGVLLPERPFRVTLAEEIPLGTYGFICLAHGAHMAGRFTVVGHDTPVPSPEEVAARAQQQLEELTAQLKVIVEEAAGAATEAGVIIAGPRDADLAEVHGGRFVPDELTVIAGEPVTWRVLVPHTISFNWPEDAVGIALVDANGRVRENFRHTALPFLRERPPTAVSGTAAGSSARASSSNPAGHIA